MDDPGTTWQDAPLQGDVGEIVTGYRKLPMRQLVVLGESGAGKTALSVLLTVGLLEDRKAGEAVPLLLPLESWNPEAETPQEYIVRRTVADYGLWADEDSRAIVEALLKEDKIVPVLDGLDELDETKHALAVESLDELAGTRRPLVVTCRSSEYERAVARSQSVLSTAAVVELRHLDLEDVIGYLSRPQLFEKRWEPVFAHLRDHPNGDLARTLATPLMTTTAKVAYRDARTDPADLVLAAQQGRVSETLFGAFLAAAYPAEADIDLHSRPSLDPDHSRREVRWLETVAFTLYCAGTRSLRWWQLDATKLAKRPLLVGSFPFAVADALIVGGLIVGFVVGGSLVSALLGGLTVRLTTQVMSVKRSKWWSDDISDRQSPPSRTDRHRGWPGTVGVGVLLAGAVTAALVVLGMDPLTAIGVSLVAGAITLLVPAARPASAGFVRAGGSQQAMLIAIRRRCVLAALGYGLTAGLLYLTTALSLSTTADAVKAAGAAAIVYGVGGGLGTGRAWMRFRMHHFLLATSRDLPWRLWRFLQNAHDRQIGRYTGPAWQFRHAILQDHLTYRARSRILYRRAVIGNKMAQSNLVHLHRAQGNLDEAITVLRRLSDAGELLAKTGLAILLYKKRDLDELRRLAEAGDTIAGAAFGAGLRAQDDVDGLSSRAAAGDEAASSELASSPFEHLESRDLRSRADSGDDAAALRLAELLRERGELEEAEAVLRRLADAPHYAATQQLAKLLREQGNVDELRRRAEGGMDAAMQQLVGLLREQLDPEELRRRAVAGDVYAFVAFSELLEEEINDRLKELRA